MRPLCVTRWHQTVLQTPIGVQPSTRPSWVYMHPYLRASKTRMVMWLQCDSRVRKTCSCVCDALGVNTAIVTLLPIEHVHSFPRRPGSAQPTPFVGQFVQFDLANHNARQKGQMAFVNESCVGLSLDRDDLPKVGFSV